MTINFSKKPVRFIEGNKELLKAQSDLNSQAGAEKGATNMKITESAYQVPSGVVASYRVPYGRDNGNVMFRRYPNGLLDYEYAKHKIMNALHTAKEEGVLNSLEKTALSVLFPGVFTYLDPSVAPAVRDVNLRISAEEACELRCIVCAFLKEELNWNSGFGGGSVAGRSSTRS